MSTTKSQVHRSQYCAIHMVVLFMAAIALPAIAQPKSSSTPFSVVACPAIGDEYEQLIAKLDAIKTSIKREACTQIELKVKSLEDLVTKDREAVMQIIENAQGTPLTAEQSAQVRAYAENVTKKVAALNDLFSRSNYCFRDDQPANQLTSLAGFVGEASQMVASLSGPWGTPIALAGNVVAGFLTGLDAVNKSRVGYDFRKRDQWISYVHSLCTYHAYREQIQHLLEPRARLTRLQQFKDLLDRQIEVLTKECDDCQTIRNEFAKQRNQDQFELQRVFQVQIDAADRRFGKPYGSYMLQSLGLREWVKSEMERIQREARGYWADSAGRRLLSQAKIDLERFLIERSAPDFIVDGINKGRADFSEFLSFVNREGRPVMMSVIRVQPDLFAGETPGWTDPVTLFEKLMTNQIDFSKYGDQAGNIRAQWMHFHDQSLSRLQSAQASSQVVQTFCAFYRRAGYYNNDVQSACSASSFKRLVETQDALASSLIKAGVEGLNMPLTDSPNTFMDKLEALTRTIEARAIGN